MSDVEYSGFTIRPAPMKLAESGKWTLEIYISRDTGAEIRERPFSFSAANTFDTEDEAILLCINLGMRIIDGKEENFSVVDL